MSDIEKKIAEIIAEEERERRSPGYEHRETLFKALYKFSLKNQAQEAAAVVRAIREQDSGYDIAIYDTLFEAHWRKKRYKEAIKAYNRAGRPFWRAEAVGRYYERAGLIEKAMREYDSLIGEYLRMDILPLPRGPIELFKLAKWYIKTDPEKSRKYLELYLRAEREDCGTGFGIRHKAQARELLKTLGH